MKNHYNALELDKNCTAKEIKDSYIKLTKKYHPDKNKSKEAGKKILEINEAYSVLRNSSTRSRYDEVLRSDIQQQQNRQNAHQNSGKYYNTKPYTYDDYFHYYQKVNSQRYPENPIFPRKFTVVLCCCVLMVFGTGLRVMYAWSEAHHRKKLNEMTARSILETQNRVNPKVEAVRHVLEGRYKRETEKKKSDS